MIRQDVQRSALRSRELNAELVVVGVDGDATSLPALRWAARSAQARAAQLEVLLAWGLTPQPRHMSRELEVMTHDLLAELRQAAEQLVDDSGVRHVPDLNVNVHVAAEPARDALNKAYDRADLLVLGAKHHSLLGSVFSVGRRTAAQARGPVALVPQGTADSAADATGGFLVGVDGSAASAAALRWACEEAARRHMQVLAITVSVSDEPFLPAAQDVEAMRERFPDLPLSYKSAPGDPKSVLAERAVSMEALVVGQHGSGHAAAGLIKRLPSVGSVSRWLGAHPPAPVVVVPAELTRRPT